MGENFRYPEDTHLLIGKIAKPHGLKGELKVVSFSGQPERIADYPELVLVNRDGRLSVPLKLASCRPQGKNVVIGLEGISDRQGAEETVGAGVLVAKKDLPEPEAGEFYWHQYVGKNITDRDGNYLGKVVSLFNNGAQDVIVASDGNDEFFVPVTREIVVSVSEECLIIDPPEGLIEINRTSL
ncbi:ribosome maturation factor RimM [Desulforhopalus singaporensis]|uniref:Ribosome maturation factor RimM n=1 Tax=Desulforhopalus singaporensis TaxID=91360 RepID=A0A1H0MII5_9BACT|nr:ribosome maturation factor RimM [Desulforhopalus singaporensis]SDO80174.1 16S rRNA processing protein RimM [Desulforhopalus singaporensis]